MTDNILNLFFLICIILQYFVFVFLKNP